jgi:Flp pilus assembly protein TadG
MRSERNHSRQRRSGATIVESAIVLALLVVILMAIFEYSRYLFISQTMANAARDGVRYASTNVDKSASFVTTDEAGKLNIREFVRRKCGGSDTLVGNFTVNVFACDNTQLYADPPVIQPKTPATAWNNATFTERIAVEITMDYRPILPVMWIPGGNTGAGIHVSFFGGSSTVPIRIAAVTGSEG